MEHEYTIMNVYDPAFKVESVEDYETLIGALARIAIEVMESDPELCTTVVWPTWCYKNWE